MPLLEKCLSSEIFWSVFSCIRTAYGEIRRISPHSVRMRENKNQKNSEYGYFSRSVCVTISFNLIYKHWISVKEIVAWLIGPMCYGKHQMFW